MKCPRELSCNSHPRFTGARGLNKNLVRSFHRQGQFWFHKLYNSIAYIGLQITTLVQLTERPKYSNRNQKVLISLMNLQTWFVFHQRTYIMIYIWIVESEFHVQFKVHVENIGLRSPRNACQFAKDMPLCFNLNCRVIAHNCSEHSKFSVSARN